MTLNYEECTYEENKLLRALRTTKNDSDGFFELVMLNNDIEKNSINSFLDEFDDDIAVYSQIVSLYFTRTSLSEFRKQMRKLAQISIKNKVTSGTATYYFIKNIACVADTRWLKQSPASKKIKVTYFYKKIEQAQNDSLPQKRKLLKEYLKEAKKTSSYIVKLLSDEKHFIIDMSSDTLLINALKNSF
jgi:hypothetical protein